MARTSGRRWKGCPMCKMHKHSGHGDGTRMPVREARKFGGIRRVSRKQVDDA